MPATKNVHASSHVRSYLSVCLLVCLYVHLRVSTRFTTWLFARVLVRGIQLPMTYEYLSVLLVLVLITTSFLACVFTELVVKRQITA